MNEPRWVAKGVVLALHDEQLAEHGGLPGLRDNGALESALDRPRNLFHYEEGGLDLLEMAAAYGFGIAKNHPFMDGNKRVSAVVTELFLALNGVTYAAEDGEIVLFWLGLAAGTFDENDLVRWLHDRCNTQSSVTPSG